jgi:hypothetical protein
MAARQIAEAWATAPPEEQAAALRLVLAEETILPTVITLWLVEMSALLWRRATALEDAVAR